MREPAAGHRLRDEGLPAPRLDLRDERRRGADGRVLADDRRGNGNARLFRDLGSHFKFWAFQIPSFRNLISNGKSPNSLKLGICRSMVTVSNPEFPGQHFSKYQII